MSVFPVQLGSKFTLHELLLYLTISLSVILSVLLIYELKSIVFWTTLIYSTIILATDFFGYATHQQVKNFYIPMAIMLAITCLAGIFVFFNIPERWCEQIRIFQLWMPSHIWFSIAYLVALYIFLLCLYDMLKYGEEQKDL